MSKFSLDVLNRCVFPHVGPEDPSVVLGATFGEDVALTRVGDDVLASHVDPIIGAVANIGWLAVHVACNDIAASGIPPRWIQLLVVIPDPADEQLLEGIMRDIGRAAREIGVCVVGGHTGYSSGVLRPLVAVTAMGPALGRTPVRTGGARPGDLVLITGSVGLEGTSILAQDFEDVALGLGLTRRDLDQARRLGERVSVVREALALAESGVNAMHDATRGGVMEALLEVARSSGVCIQAEADSFPGDPVVPRFAEAFGFDPLWMLSSGALAVTLPPDRREAVSRLLDALAVPYGFVGRVVPGAGVSLIQDGRAHRFESPRCETDELARMWSLYPRNA